MKKLLAVLLLFLIGCEPSEEAIQRAMEDRLSAENKCKEISKQFEKVQNVFIHRGSDEAPLCVIELNKVNEEFYRLPVEISFQVEKLPELLRFIRIKSKHGVKK